MTSVKLILRSDADTTVFDFIRMQAERLRRIGRTRTADTYIEALSSIMKFRENADFHFCQFDSFMMERYEAWMRTRHLCRNTTSFYMRVLRTIYNRAAGEGLSCDGNPFKNVYTGIDKTSRRAITLREIIRIKRLDLSGDKPLEFKANQVIKGWTEALTLMPVGSKWELYIPYDLAYGERDSGKIKPFSALIFTVELVEIVKK